MRLIAQDHLVAAAAMHQQADQVAHRARRHEQAGFLAQAIGRECLQPLDGRVIAQHVVADLGFCHGSAHGRRGFGHGI